MRCFFVSHKNRRKHPPFKRKKQHSTFEFDLGLQPIVILPRFLSIGTHSILFLEFGILSLVRILILRDLWMCYFSSKKLTLNWSLERCFLNSNVTKK